MSAITHVHGNANQRDDFEAAADFLLLMAPNQSSNNSNHRVSAVKNDKVKGKHKTGKETGVEIRDYTKKEYNKLSHAERKELADLRKQEKNKGNTPTSDNTVAALTQQVKDLEERLIAAINTTPSTDTATTTATTNDTSTQQRAPLSNPLNQRN